MKHRSPRFARLLALILAAVMVFGVLTVGVSAAKIENVKQYNTYTCLGDSIAAGFGPDNLDYVGMHKIDFAYHSIVADAVGARTF